MNNNRNVALGNIEIFWDDLTLQKQQEVLDAFGDNCNYDIFPIAILSAEEEVQDFSAHKI